MLNFFFKKLASPQNQNRLIIFIALILFGLILLMNYIYPTTEDDWTYSFIWHIDGCRGEKIMYLHDLFISQYAHYMEWGGRTVVHTIAQVLLIFDPILQDILNTLAYIGMMILIYKYANITKPPRAIIFLLCCLLFWFFQPIIISTCFWITGSANYLWGMLIILSFIYPFYSLYIKENGQNSILKSIFLFIAGIIAGWTNENTAIAMFFLIVVIAILLKIQKVNIPNWVYWGIVGCIIGILFLVLAPGNMARYNAEGGSTDNLFSLDILLPRLQQIFKYYLKYILIPSILSIISIIYFWKKGTPFQRRKLFAILLLFYISAHVALLLMLATPIFPERAMFGLIIFFIIIIGTAYANSNINFNNKKIQISITSIFFILIIIFTTDYCYKLNKIWIINKTLKEREKVIEKGKKIGIKDYVFDDQIVISKRYHYWDLLEDENAGKNIAYSHYYNINSVRVIDRISDTVNQYLLKLKMDQDSIINKAYENK